MAVMPEMVDLGSKMVHYQVAWLMKPGLKLFEQRPFWQSGRTSSDSLLD